MENERAKMKRRKNEIKKSRGKTVNDQKYKKQQHQFMISRVVVCWSCFCFFCSSSLLYLELYLQFLNTMFFTVSLWKLQHKEELRLKVQTMKTKIPFQCAHSFNFRVL